MRKKNLLFKIIPFLLLRILIRTLKSDLDPVKSRPDPQHCIKNNGGKYGQCKIYCLSTKYCHQWIKLCRGSDDLQHWLVMAELQVRIRIIWRNPVPQ